MAAHNWVVRKIAAYHVIAGDMVCADHYRGFPKPPTFFGPRGAGYIPDIWVENKRLAYEVEPFEAAKHSLPQLKAFAKDPSIEKFIVVLCTGTNRGVERRAKTLTSRGLLDGLKGEIELWNWRDLFDQLGIERPASKA